MPPSTPRRLLRLVWLVGALCLQAGTPSLAQSGLPAPTPAAVLAEEPRALRQLIEQGNTLETAEDATEGAWQAAVLYCQAASLGSIEGQYRLGMLYAFGQGVPEHRALAAALFSLAAAQGHAQATEMLETIQLTSATLPACMTHAELPEKAPPVAAIFNGLRLELNPRGGDSIERFVRDLPRHKQWIVPLTTKLSAWYDLDPRLVLSVIAAESNFEQHARSPKQAQGLMQLIPDTAERFNVKNAFDATQNLRGGMRYLRWLLSHYRGNLPYALAAYNAGEGRVNQYQGVPPFNETRAYVRKIIGLYGKVRHAFDERLAEAPEWLAGPGR